jgi:hypothetical protein
VLIRSTTIKVLADARLGAGTVRRLEQDADRTVEFQLGGLETSLFEFGLARLEMTVGPVDQRDNRVQFRNYSLGGR